MTSNSEDEAVLTQIQRMGLLADERTPEARRELVAGLDAENLAVIEAATVALMTGWGRSGLDDVLEAASGADLQVSGTMFETVYLHATQSTPSIWEWLDEIESRDARGRSIVLRFRDAVAWHSNGLGSGDHRHI